MKLREVLDQPVQKPLVRRIGVKRVKMKKYPIKPIQVPKAEDK